MGIRSHADDDQHFNGAESNLGFAFILTPPKVSPLFATVANVNVIQLVIQWLGVLVAGGLAFTISGKK